MDKLAQKMTSFSWIYADKDPAALADLESRIANAGRSLGLITYSDLARGVVFHLPQIAMETRTRFGLTTGMASIARSSGSS
jgi:hypothetical protein